METISVDDGSQSYSRNLRLEYPSMMATSGTLGEYAALFALRRALEEDATLDAGAMVGLCHYRRFAVLKAPDASVVNLSYEVVSDDFIPRLDAFLQPQSRTIVMPAPVDLGSNILSHYAVSHEVVDVMRFMAIACDMNVVDGRTVAAYLSQSIFIPSPTVGIYPVGWLIQVLAALEDVAVEFESRYSPRRTGYQSRAAGFSCERLHSLLLMNLLSRWPEEAVVGHKTVMLAGL